MVVKGSVVKQLLMEAVAKVPNNPTGFTLCATQVSLAGEALFLFSNGPGNSETQKGCGSSSDFKLVIAGEQQCQVNIPPLDLSFPMVDIFSDGSIVIVGGRCQWRDKEDFDLNGVIVDPQTRMTSRFLVGDGVQDIGVDGDDRIWVSYFDEGIYGNFGWGCPGHPEPVGQSGLNCFERTGNIVWRFASDARFINDCYALNVTAHETRFYYYSDFELGTVSKGFDVKFQKTGIAGSHAFAIFDDTALFTAQYREPQDIVTLVRMNTINKALKYRFRAPSGAALSQGRFIGRGHMLYYITASDWYRLDIRLL